MENAKRTTAQSIQKLAEVGTRIDLLEQKAIATTLSKEEAFDTLHFLIERAQLIAALTLPNGIPAMRQEEVQVLRAKLNAASQDASDTIRYQGDDSLELFCLPDSAELGIPQFAAILSARKVSGPQPSSLTDRRSQEAPRSRSSRRTKSL